MNFIIDEQTQKVIEKKGGIFTIGQISCGGWAGSVKRLWSGAGSKKEKEFYFNKYEHQGITIYIDKELDVSNPIEINLKSNLPLFGPSFIVQGVSL